MTYVAFVASAAGSGGTITTSFTNGNSTQNFSQSGSLDKFDSSLGTLVSATIRLTLHYQMTGTATLFGGSPPYDILLMEQCSMNASSSLSALNSIFLTTNPEIDDYVLTPIVSIDFGNSPYAFATVSSTVFVDISLNSILASLTGSGTFTVSASSISSLVLGGGDGFVTVSGTEIGGFDASITYTYT